MLKQVFMSELRAALTEQVAETESVNPAKRYNFTGKKVLLVEDNEWNREIVTAILEEAGLIVECVCKGCPGCAGCPYCKTG